MHHPLLAHSLCYIRQPLNFITLFWLCHNVDTLHDNILVIVSLQHRCLQAWAYQGNARIVDASLSSNFTKIGYSIKDEVQWMNIYLPCPDTR